MPLFERPLLRAEPIESQECLTAATVPYKQYIFLQEGNPYLPTCPALIKTSSLINAHRPACQKELES